MRNELGLRRSAAVARKSLIFLVRRFLRRLSAAVCGGWPKSLILLVRWLCGGVRWCGPYTTYRGEAPALWGAGASPKDCSVRGV